MSLSFLIYLPGFLSVLLTYYHKKVGQLTIQHLIGSSIWMGRLQTGCVGRLSPRVGRHHAWEPREPYYLPLRAFIFSLVQQLPRPEAIKASVPYLPHKMATAGEIIAITARSTWTGTRRQVAAMGRMVKRMGSLVKDVRELFVLWVPSAVLLGC